MAGFGLNCTKRSSFAQSLKNALALRRRQLIHAEHFVHSQHFGPLRRGALAPVAAFAEL